MESNRHQHAKGRMMEAKYSKTAGVTRRVTRVDIQQLALHQPILMNYLRLEREGLMSWDEAMQGAAFALAKDWLRIFEVVIGEKSRRVSAPFFMPDGKR